MKACGEIAGTRARIEILHDASGAPCAPWDDLAVNRLTARLSISSASPVAVAVPVVVPAEPGAGR